MANNIISAGHICLDITPVFPETVRGRKTEDIFQPGSLLRMEAADIHTGGSVSNTGLALKLLGNDVTLLGKIGKDAFGEIVKSIAASYGASGLIEDEKSSTSYSVVLAVPGCDRMFLHNPGANDSFTDADIHEEALEDAVLFHFGYPPIMKRMYENGGEELAKLLRRMKEHGIATSLDMAAVDPYSEAGKADWDSILRNALPYTDFFLPSFEELCFMLDRGRYERLNGCGDMTAGLDLDAEAMPLIDKALEMGCATALIKCGTAGMAYGTAGSEKLKNAGSRLCLDLDAWADRRGTQPCFKAETVLSGTGAGDVSIAAWLTALLNGEPPEVCAALAAAEGAASVTAYDALSGLLPLDELKRRIAAGWETM